MKRPFCVVAVSLMLLASAAALLAWSFCRRSVTRIDRQGFGRIETGMTAKEVEEILGGPEGDYSTAPLVSDVAGSDIVAERALLLERRANKMIFAREWIGDSGLVHVWFDCRWGIITPDSKVVDKQFIPVRPKQQPFLDRLHRWFRW
jgi:hypothetical protein